MRICIRASGAHLHGRPQAYTGHGTPVLGLSSSDDRIMSLSARSLCMHHIKTGCAGPPVGSGAAFAHLRVHARRYLEWRVALPPPSPLAPPRTAVRVNDVIAVACGLELHAYARARAAAPVLCASSLPRGGWSVCTRACVRSYDAHSGAVLTVEERDSRSPRRPRASVLLRMPSASRAAAASDAAAASRVAGGAGRHTDAISCMASAAHAEGGAVFTGAWDATVALWELGRGAAEGGVVVSQRWRSVAGPLADAAHGRGHSMAVTCVVAAVVDGQRGLAGVLLLSGSLDGHVRRWDAATGACLFVTREPHAAGITSLILAHGGGGARGDDVCAVSAAVGDAVRCWDTGTGALSWAAEVPEAAVNALAAVGEGSACRLLVGTTAGVSVMRAFSGTAAATGGARKRSLAPVRTHTADGGVREFHVSPDGSFVDVITRRSLERHVADEDFALVWTSLLSSSRGLQANKDPDSLRVSSEGGSEGAVQPPDAAATLALEFEPMAVVEAARAPGGGSSGAPLRCALARRSDGSLWAFDWSGTEYRRPLWRACGARPGAEVASPQAGESTRRVLEPAGADEVRGAAGVDTGGNMKQVSPRGARRVVLETIKSERWGAGGDTAPARPRQGGAARTSGAERASRLVRSKREARDMVVSAAVCPPPPPLAPDVQGFVFVCVGYREMTPFVGRAMRVTLDASWRGGPCLAGARVTDLTDDGRCTLKFEQPQWDANGVLRTEIEHVSARLVSPEHATLHCAQAWNASSGELLWQCPRSDDVRALFAAPAAAMAVQVPSGGGPARLFVACGSGGGDVHCIGGQSGEMLFTVRTSCALISLTVDGGAVYVGAADSTVRAMDTSGGAAPSRALCAWASVSTTGPPVRLEACGRNGVVLAASHWPGDPRSPDGALRVLDSREGLCLWEARAGETTYVVVPAGALGRGGAGVGGDVVVTADVTEVADGVVSSFAVRAARSGAVIIRSVDDDHSGGPDAIALLRGAVTQLACMRGFVFARTFDAVVILAVTDARTLVPHDRVTVPVEGGIVHMHVVAEASGGGDGDRACVEWWRRAGCTGRARAPSMSAEAAASPARAAEAAAATTPGALFLLDKFGRTVTLELAPVLHLRRVRVMHVWGSESTTTDRFMARWGNEIDFVVTLVMTLVDTVQLASFAFRNSTSAPPSFQNIQVLSASCACVVCVSGDCSVNVECAFVWLCVVCRVRVVCLLTGRVCAVRARPAAGVGLHPPLHGAVHRHNDAAGRLRARAAGGGVAAAYRACMIPHHGHERPMCPPPRRNRWSGTTSCGRTQRGGRHVRRARGWPMRRRLATAPRRRSPPPPAPRRCSGCSSSRSFASRPAGAHALAMVSLCSASISSRRAARTCPSCACC